MNVGLGFIEQVRSQASWVAQELTHLVAGITTSYHTEHNPDDTHGTIHASGSIAERGRTVALGDWADVPYTAALFTGSGGMTWTVSQADAITMRYQLVGSTMTLALFLNATSVTAPLGSNLAVALPAAVQPSRVMGGGCSLSDNGTLTAGSWFVDKGYGAKINFTRADGAAFAAAVNTTNVLVVASFEVSPITI